MPPSPGGTPAMFPLREHRGNSSFQITLIGWECLVNGT